MLRFSFLLLVPLTAHSAEATNPGLSAGNYVQAVLALLLIVALMIGLAWLARKMTGGQGFGQGGMKIIGGVTLGPRERIVLVEVGETWLVIGIVPGQIRTLHRFPKGADIELGGLPQPDHKPFASWLKSVAERQNHG